jgi:aromatic-L-amino-acid/L-tryptophan decarboxylase
VDREPLTLAPGEFRRLAHKVADLVADHHEGLRDLPPVRTGDRAALDAVLREPVPLAPGDVDAALDTAAEVVLAHMQLGNHPRYFARVPGPSSPVGPLADALTSGFNAIATSWAGGSGPTTLELVVTEWLAQLLGMPPETEGVLVSGGSMSSLTAFAAARLARLGGHDPEATVYCSAQTHASLPRALRALGFADDRVRVLPCDDALRLPLDAVADAITSDRAAGLRPFLLIGNAGTTNTGAVDPLPELADLAAHEGLWFHVDGAYGAPGALVPAGAEVLAGLGRADSLTVDPHKWLFAPYECGVLLVREPGLLARAFAMSPEYLADTTGPEPSLRDRSLQLTRTTRALKLWLTIKTFGLDEIRAGIAHGIALAEHAESRVRSMPGWSVVTPAQLAVVTFTPPAGEPAALAQALLESGYAALSSTVLDGRSVLRLCTINPSTTFAEIDETLARLDALARSA